MGTPAAAIAGAIGGAIASDFIRGFYQPFTEGTGNIARWEIGKKLGIKNWFAQAYDSFTDAEANPVIGYSAAGMMHVVYELFEASIRMSMVVEGEMIEELFLEMLQEGLSNAIQYSYGGAWQSQLNVYRGASPPYADDVDDVMRLGKRMDEKLRSFLVASTGASIPNFGRQALSAFQRHISDELTHLRPWFTDKLRDRDDAYYRPLVQLHTIAMSYAEAQAEKAWMMWRRAYDMINDAARRYLARVNELLDELESVKVWHDAELISEDDATLIAREIKEEGNVIESYFDELENTIISEAQTVEQEITCDFDPVFNVISRFDNLAYNLCTWYGEISKSLTEDFIALIEETLKRLRAYRYYSEVTTPPDAKVLVFEIEYIAPVGGALGAFELGYNALGGEV